MFSRDWGMEVTGFLLGWWKCSEIQTGDMVYNIVSILKTELYTWDINPQKTCTQMVMGALCIIFKSSKQ
jgi:hypothetical protein